MWWTHVQHHVKEQVQNGTMCNAVDAAEFKCGRVVGHGTSLLYIKCSVVSTSIRHNHAHPSTSRGCSSTKHPAAQVSEPGTIWHDGNQICAAAAAAIYLQQLLHGGQLTPTPISLMLYCRPSVAVPAWPTTQLDSKHALTHPSLSTHSLSHNHVLQRTAAPALASRQARWPLVQWRQCMCNAQ